MAITQTGRHTIGISAYTKAGTARYLLAIAAAHPPPCASDAACGCPDLRCETQGPSAGQCVSALPVAAAANDSPAVAAPIGPVGAAIRGELESVGSEDWFRVTLDPAIPVDFETRTFCGTTLDTEILVYDALGQIVIGGATTGGEGAQARVIGFVAPEAGEYLVRVADEAGGHGPYVLETTDARCTSDADCACGDSQCDGSVGAPGQCVPLLSSTEGDAPVGLAVGQRRHGRLEEPYDIDAFSLFLGAGAWALETLPYCGTELDTELAVYVTMENSSARTSTAPGRSSPSSRRWSSISPWP